MHKHRHACICQLHTSSLSHEQRGAQVCLELRNALADGRRLDVLARCGSSHALAFADGDEEAQRLEIEVPHAANHSLSAITMCFQFGTIEVPNEHWIAAWESVRLSNLASGDWLVRRQDNALASPARRDP